MAFRVYLLLSAAAVAAFGQKAPPPMTFATSLDPSGYCQPVTFTVTLAGLSVGTAPPPVPTGTITLSDGSTPIHFATLTNGMASFPISDLGAGSHTLTAAYSGDANYGAISRVLVQVVTQAATSTSLTSAPNPSTLGQTVTLTATLTATPCGATGTVTFLDGTNPMVNLPVAGTTVTYQTSALTVGGHTLSARYNGDTNNAASASNVFIHFVNTGSSSTSLTVAPNPATVGQTVNMTAPVTPASATGSVIFMDGATTLGKVNLTNGAASFATGSLPPGTHILSATYSGDSNVGASTSPAATLVVNPAGPGPLTVTGPASLPGGSIEIAYPPQTFTASGGTGKYTWSLVANGTTTNDLTISVGGVLSGSPHMAGTFQVMVQVQDSASPPATATKTYSVKFDFAALPPASLTVNTQPSTPADQPVPQFSFGQAYPAALKGTFQLSFTPNAAGLPASYSNGAVQFAGGGTTAQVNLPAGSTAAVALPAVQIGSVAGTIGVRLTALADTVTGQSVPLPSPAPAASITVPRIAPVVVPGSVKIANIGASGFQLTFDANSTPRDLARANVTFSAASGAQLTGTQSFTVPLDTAAASWFPSAAGVAAGGAFSVTIAFGYSGDTSALGPVSVTLTNSVGTSAAVSGGR